MELSFLDEKRFEAALQAVLADPFANASMIAYLTEFRSGSTFVFAGEESGPIGLLGVYWGADFPHMALWCEDSDVFERMLRLMVERHPELQVGPIWSLAGKKSLDYLEKTIQIDLLREELQLSLDLRSVVDEIRDDGPTRAISLTAAHLPELDALYKLVPPEIWRSEAVQRGPYRGRYEGGQLVAAAGVHWVSPWLAEIGNVAVHPNHRRKGLAQLCVSSVIADLKMITQTAYLTVFADNEPAIRLYQKMGFAEQQRMWLVKFELAGAQHLRANPYDESLTSSRPS